MGSTSYITDASGEVYQHLEYFAFGGTFVEEHSNTNRTPFLFNGKELDEETGLYYYGARYYDEQTSIWLSVDPLAEKYPGLSSYAYVANNPINAVDPNGEDIIVLSMTGSGELRRVAMDGEDKYVKVNQEAFAKASASFTNDNQDYNTMLSVYSLRNQERNTDRTDLIAEQTGVSISITGNVRQENSLIADIDITFQADFDDGSSFSISCSDGVAGGYGNGSPENGDYAVGKYNDRSPAGWYNKGMNRDGVGFSYNLDPSFDTGRTFLRIHPDGNNEGTLGCIGLSGNCQQLSSFRNTLNGYLKNRGTLPVNININNNPNNNGSNGNTVPNVNE